MNSPASTQRIALLPEVVRNQIAERLLGLPRDPLIK